MLHAITVCHTLPEMIGFSLAMFEATKDYLVDRWVFVDNCWPHLKGGPTQEETSQIVAKMVRGYGGELLSPGSNLGGHGGFNHALKHIEPADQDLILWYDPDSNPARRGWLRAMVEVMNADPSIVTLSLYPPPYSASYTNAIKVPDFKSERVAGHEVRTFAHPEMFSVTLWRASFIGPQGVEAEHRWYGQIEAPAYRRAQAQGKRNAWMGEYSELPCPILHPIVYRDYKWEHGGNRFHGTFLDFAREKGELA